MPASPWMARRLSYLQTIFPRTWGLQPPLKSALVSGTGAKTDHAGNVTAWIWLLLLAENGLLTDVTTMWHCSFVPLFPFSPRSLSLKRYWRGFLTGGTFYFCSVRDVLPVHLRQQKRSGTWPNWMSQVHTAHTFRWSFCMACIKLRKLPVLPLRSRFDLILFYLNRFF